jgi:hypothetical protein
MVDGRCSMVEARLQKELVNPFRLKSRALAQAFQTDRPSTIDHRPSTIDHRPSTIDHRPSTIDHPPSLTLRRTQSTIDHRSSRRDLCFVF